MLDCLETRKTIKNVYSCCERKMFSKMRNHVIGKCCLFTRYEHYYWYMPLPDNLAVDLINRTTTDHPEYRDGAYYYKGK